MSDYTFKKIYYISIFILGLEISYAIFAGLSWPLLAEIPLIICVFLEFLFLSRFFFNAFFSKKDFATENILSKIMETIN